MMKSGPLCERMPYNYENSTDDHKLIQNTDMLTEYGGSALGCGAFAVYSHQFPTFYIHVHFTWFIDDIFTCTTNNEVKQNSQMRH